MFFQTVVAMEGHDALKVHNQFMYDCNLVLPIIFQCPRLPCE